MKSRIFTAEPSSHLFMTQIAIKESVEAARLRTMQIYLGVPLEHLGQMELDRWASINWLLEKYHVKTRFFHYKKVSEELLRKLADVYQYNSMLKPYNLPGQLFNFEDGGLGFADVDEVIVITKSAHSSGLLHANVSYIDRAALFPNGIVDNYCYNNSFFESPPLYQMYPQVFLDSEIPRHNCICSRGEFHGLTNWCHFKEYEKGVEGNA